MKLFATLMALSMLAGCGMPSLLIRPVSNTNELEEIDAQDAPKKSGLVRGGGGKIAIIEVEGMLVNARSGG